LYLYKGFNWEENLALNSAGLFAILIAVITTVAPDESPHDYTFHTSLHRVFAFLFFLAIAYVCIFRAADTGPYIASTTRSAFYRWTYRLLGIAMIVVPGVALYLAVVWRRHHELYDHRILFVEWAAIWVFGAYWLLKSKEIRDSHADHLVPVRHRHKVPSNATPSTDR